MLRIYCIPVPENTVGNVPKNTVQDFPIFTVFLIPVYKRGGLVIYHKRLEKNRFTLPRYDATRKSYSISWHDLVLMVEGISLEKTTRKKRLEISYKTA
ncbi:MAG: IS66 family insertion sequence element accessory protein TnpB [Petrimonas sp.]|nr:IS66 family insertion sequence element accessory protein TnpB [Petrimonas sp.]